MTLTQLKRKAWFAFYAVKPFKPLMLVHHLRGRLASTLFSGKGFRVIDLALTYDCNLFCNHCSASGLKSGADHLSLDDYREIVRSAKKLDNLSYNLTGGEPLLFDGLFDIISILEPRRHYITVQTNAMALDAKMAARLVSAGVNCISTSVDSIDPGVHNRFRGNKNAWANVFEGIQNARKAGLQVLVGCTITHRNIRSAGLRTLIELVNRMGSVFLYNLAVPCGNWQGSEDILLTGTDRMFLDQLLQEYPGSSTDHEPGRRGAGCPAGLEKLYITPYGDVLPCPFIHISFGNIKTRPLTEIVAEMQRVSWFRQYQHQCIAAESVVFRKTVLNKIPDHGRPVPFDDIFKALSSELTA